MTPGRFDATCPAFARDPFATYALRHAVESVGRITLANGRDTWLVTGMAAARTVLADRRFSAVRSPALDAATPRGQLEAHMLNTDAPVHPRLRALAQTAFTGARISALTPRITHIVEDILDALPTDDQIDLVSAYAFHVPVLVMCEVLGVPSEDRDALRRATQVVASPTGSRTGETWEWLLDYFTTLIADKRAHPTDDLFSDLVHARDAQGRLTEQELLAMAFLLLFAGYETTMNLIGSGILALLSHPEQRRTLTTDAAWDVAVNELLRHGSPLESATWRWATEDVEVAGALIPRGASVLVSLAAANRDPAFFTDPDSLDLARHPNRHLAFGHGPHFCLGTGLAQVEARIALRHIVERFPGMRLATSPHDIAWRPGLLVRGPMTLPVRLDDPLDRLRAHAERRVAAGLRRTLTPRDQRDAVLDLASNDYLGLTRDQRVIDAAIDAARRWGGGSTGSRLVTGSTTLHELLERDLATFTGAEAGLVLSSGYLANLAALTALAGPGDLLISDAQNHASMIDACRLSRAQVKITPTCTPDAVAALLAARTQPHAVVVTDAVFSVDGTLAPLRDLADICARHAAILVIDEAHALGVVGDGGRGAAHLAGLAGRCDVVLTATLSKAFGSQGGAVLGPRTVIDHLINTARPFIFDTGLAPACVGAAHAALVSLRADPSLATRARAHARELSRAARAAGWQTSDPAAAVTSVLVGEPRLALAAAAGCLEGGVRVGCFRPPSVPDGISRLRLTARADLTTTDLDLVAETLLAVRREVLG